VAKTAFADQGADVSLDEIARRAGVGIGTLYRHFPTRDVIVEAVYRREVEKLAGSAPRLLGSLSLGEALREWMRGITVTVHSIDLAPIRIKCTVTVIPPPANGCHRNFPVTVIPGLGKRRARVC
jgi:AcrR family transcriptional regulator